MSNALEQIHFTSRAIKRYPVMMRMVRGERQRMSDGALRFAPIGPVLPVDRMLALIQVRDGLVTLLAVEAALEKQLDTRYQGAQFTSMCAHVLDVVREQMS